MVGNTGFSKYLVTGASLLLGGLLCLSPLSAQKGQKGGPEPSKSDNKPTPPTPSADPAASAVDPHTYVIGPEDLLFIRVWREPDVTGPVSVRPDGKITLALVGELQAGGLTAEQLQAKVKDSLGKYFNSPDVTVSVTQVNSKKFYIDGEVGRPGPYPLSVPTKVLEALSQAGGFRDFANPKKIVILRKGERLKFNYKEVVKGKSQEENVFLEPGDHIIVP